MANLVTRGLRTIRLMITRGFTGSGAGTFTKICRVSDEPNVCQNVSSIVNVCIMNETRPSIIQKLSTESGL